MLEAHRMNGSLCHTRFAELFMERVATRSPSSYDRHWKLFFFSPDKITCHFFLTHIIPTLCQTYITAWRPLHARIREDYTFEARFGCMLTTDCPAMLTKHIIFLPKM